MIIRYVIRMSLYPHERWTGGLVPIFFHWVLAWFLLIVVVLGAVFGRRFIAELRHDWYTEIADTNFEGVTLQIGFLFGP